MALKLWHKAYLVAQTGIDAEDAKKYLARKFQNMERHDIDEAYRMGAVLHHQATELRDLIFENEIRENEAIERLKESHPGFYTKTYKKALLLCSAARPQKNQPNQKLLHAACGLTRGGVNDDKAVKYLARQFPKENKSEIAEALDMGIVLTQQASIFVDLLFIEVIQEKAAIRKLKTLCTHFSEKTCEKALKDACFDDIR